MKFFILCQVVKLNLNIKKTKILIILFIFSLFLFKSIFFLDPDFGWHIKMGELILSSGVPKTDQFSYTMPSFPHVDSAWLSGLFMHYSLKAIGWFGTGVLFSFLAILTVVISLKFKIGKNTIVPTVLVGGILMAFAGIRPQVLSWLFFAILVTFFLNSKYWKRLRFFLPIIFIFWANLHGGFGMGFFAFFLFLVLKDWKRKTVSFLDWLIFATSILATLVNPYGFGVWQEVGRAIFDSTTKWTISEWLPALFNFLPSLWTFVALSVFMVFRYRKKLSAFEKILYLLLFLAGMSSIRHIPFWIIVALPITIKSISLFEAEAKKVKMGKERFSKAYTFFLFLSIIIVLVPLVFGVRSLSFLNEENSYPKKAIEYLKNNQSSSQMFSVYEWGGYLIWKYPEKKVFIDGRMATWKWNTKIKDEANYAYKDYLALRAGDVEFKSAVAKYRIDTVLLPVKKQKKKSVIDFLSEKIENKFSKKGKYDDIYSQLKRNGWKVVYSDDVSVIYRKM